MPSAISIRLAQLDEQSLLESLQRRASLANPGDREALLAHPDAITVPLDQLAAACVFVAERDGVVAGFAAVLPRADGGAELDALFVEPHLWKRGIGRRLLEHVVEVARTRAARFLHVVGNPHAEGFYVSCGFHVEGTIQMRFGTGLDMRMWLSPENRVLSNESRQQQEIMMKVALFVRLEAKPGKEQEVADFLAQGLALANQEATTPVWFALRLGPATFAIFDAFRDEGGRQAHLGGPIAQALMAQAPHLLATPPSIERLDVLGSKLSA